MSACRWVLTLTLAAASAAAQTPAAAGTISGVVRDASTHAPMAGLPIQTSGSTTTTGDDGSYTLRNVPAGRRRVAAGSRPVGQVTRMATLEAGGDIRSFDLDLAPNGTISGKVVDENGEPVPKVPIALVSREYYQGSLRYYGRRQAFTNDLGEYRLDRILPGTAFLVLARPMPRISIGTAISDAPTDPKLRRLAVNPTFYPSSASPEGGELLELRPGEQKENVDIRLLRSQSYCLEGVLRMEGRPAGLHFTINPLRPSLGVGPSGGLAGVPPGGESGPDGRIRFCGLPAGAYRFSSFSGDVNYPEAFAAGQFAITDSDVHEIPVVTQPRIPLRARVVWADTPPEKPVESRISIRLRLLEQAFGGTAFAAASIPGEVSLTVRGSLTGEEGDPIMAAYSVNPFGLSGSLYVKDITYGNESVLHRPLRLGSAVAGTQLRVVIGHDGGVLRAKVADGEGKPALANVVIIPKDTILEAGLADRQVTGQTDQNGIFSSPALVPGAYYVLATPDPVTDRSPETIGKLWAARVKAEEVEVGPNATLDVTLEPIPLD